ncbi:uncharacterized protein LOC112464995 isoform X1 [Temnothorax curvispinosus]|uniref:Uncharacterized protein LOC112464995 isoform X1 n=1 Tax=Temnothorax curvispinosus TaxID=300111 RepID=A0A6J1R0F8_9HYME|nr:uncharacterized protein LOC112464995 isoform X1 [Temnothorax curvispinosus]XP_024888097.1 uncharacterized protein LOC112464995 isoform X1 [Temnothorax curvispinosus]
MRERIKTIKRCYKALQYEINKQEALKKISTLHYELKFKDTNHFSDRFLQTASIIKKNLTVFKSACDHVDIVTIILDFLHTIGVKFMFDDEYTFDEIIIICIMDFVCEEPEISSFLKAALINNSRLEQADNEYEVLISNCFYEMIVLEDSDLYAVISYLRITPSFLLKIKKIYVQESIKQKFVWLLKKYFQGFYTYTDLPISTFHTKKELYSFPSYLQSLYSINMVSIWSEDITAAKVLATTLRRDITFINAHFEFCPNITFSWKCLTSTFDFCQYFDMLKDKDENKIDPNKYTGLCYDLFYDGLWQKPVKDTYWIHNGNTYANATKEDVMLCVESSAEASKSWSILPFVSRKKVLENLASTLECNGKFLLADTVLKWLKSSNINNTLKCQDERLELTNFRGSKNVVSIFHPDEVVSFGYLTLSLMIGNCVIVLFDKRSCSLAPFFNMFSTAEIPPGVINLLSRRDLSEFICGVNYEPDEAFKHCTSINHIILPLK